MSTTLIDVLAYIDDEADGAQLADILRQAQLAMNARLRMLRPGDTLIWTDKHGSDWEGELEQVNRKSVSLRSTTNPRFRGKVRVPIAWCRTV